MTWLLWHVLHAAYKFTIELNFILQYIHFAEKYEYVVTFKNCQNNINILFLAKIKRFFQLLKIYDDGQYSLYGHMQQLFFILIQNICQKVISRTSVSFYTDTTDALPSTWWISDMITTVIKNWDFVII